MPEMLSYIFSTLEAAERSIRDQSKINRNIAIFAVAITAYSIMQTRRIRALEYKIGELKSEEKEE